MVFSGGAYGVIFLSGDLLPPVLVGILVVAMVLVAGVNGVAAGRPDMPSAETLQARALKLGNKLFVPALAIPAVTIICAVLLKDVQFGSLRLLPQKSETLAGLGAACMIALIIACVMTRSTPMQSVRESRRLFEAMGWAVLLPQLLAVLGIIFTDAGVGKAISYLTTEYMAVDNRLIAVAAYCIGMAVFTMIMGNAFAAFPVITAGIGIPILIMQHGANPAVLCAIGMFSGYCGTLMTPMAANFNIVPAALLELEDKNAVIKAQVGTAIPLLAANIVLMYFLAF
ncbi:DUF979 domain-containing protein [Neisseria leonii]|uniref:DUF979 domain-containing protein n=1 Tax=Neisseria leonii TaxID=2995413 RepID=UPI00237C26B9|nr:DUF979 domain-containing protein [Neisseria sp. 3986]MDD9325876.1 DUF979 domain-containing protein [Neisseria sp. 3986]